jgi:hypothetical protein
MRTGDLGHEVSDDVSEMEAVTNGEGRRGEQCVKLMNTQRMSASVSHLKGGCVIQFPSFSSPSISITGRSGVCRGG